MANNKKNNNDKELLEARMKIANKNRENLLKKENAQPKEISLSLFEKNAKLYNKRFIRRSYVSYEEHYNEFVNTKPLSARNKFVIEATIDKEYVKPFIELLKENGFNILGSKNYYNLENVIKDYNENPSMYQVQKEAIAAIEKDVELLKNSSEEFENIENDDSRFYFLPYNDKVESLFEFVEVYKDTILKFSQENDITIMLKVSGYCNQIEGFLGFNFFDADKTDEEVVVDFASRVTVVANLNSNVSVFAAGLLLSGIGESEDELKALNTHIVVENIKILN